MVFSEKCLKIALFSWYKQIKGYQRFFVKKDKKWAKSTFWLVKYISVDQKEPFIDIYLLDIKPKFGVGST